MINYIDLYNYIDNPLTDELLYHLVECYSKNENVHSHIVNAHNKNSEQRMIDEDELYEFLFEKWKRNILSLSESYMQKLFNNRIIEKDFWDLKKLLNNLAPITTKKEYMDLILNNKLIYKYGWQSIGNKTSWTHINSSLLNAWKSPHFLIEHKLCLNCPQPYIEKIVYLLLKEFEARRIPYHLKFDTSGKRDDSIVIYSNTTYLDEFIQSIRKTRLYNKELFSNIQEAPLLMGKIEPWLGYASETKDYKKMTFSEIRSNIIYSSIKSCLRKWVYENKYLKIKSGNKDIYFCDFISSCLANIVISKYKKTYNKYIEEGREKDFYEHHGLTKEDLYSPNLKKLLEEKISPNILEMLRAYYNKELIPCINIRTVDWKKITVTNEDLKNTIKALSLQILKNYPYVMDLIKSEIENQCNIHNVDFNKFCFDITRREALFTYQKKVLNKKK